MHARTHEHRHTHTKTQHDIRKNFPAVLEFQFHPGWKIHAAPDPDPQPGVNQFIHS